MSLEHMQKRIHGCRTVKLQLDPHGGMLSQQEPPPFSSLDQADNSSSHSGSASIFGPGLQPHIWAPKPSPPWIRVWASPGCPPTRRPLCPEDAEEEEPFPWLCPSAAPQLQTHSCRDRLQ